MAHVGGEPRQPLVQVHPCAVPPGQSVDGERMPDVVRPRPRPALRGLEALFSEQRPQRQRCATDAQRTAGCLYEQRGTRTRWRGGTRSEDTVVIDARGLRQISDEGPLREAIAQVLAAHEKAVSDYRGGNAKTFGFLVGQVMRATKGQANPNLAGRLLREALDGGG